MSDGVAQCCQIKDTANVEILAGWNMMGFRDGWKDRYSLMKKQECGLQGLY